MSTTNCQDPNFCRGGCCRDFFGTQFCDVESNCIAAPTWIIALVPAMLGVAALVLVIIVIIRLRNRRIITTQAIGSQSQVGPKNFEKDSQSERRAGTDRPFRASGN